MAEGNIGAGAGAAVGQMAGPNRAMKSGLGSAAIALPAGLVIAAIVVVNASGDVIDPATGRVVAGARNTDGTLLDLRKLLRSGGSLSAPSTNNPGEHTTIGVVATNARLTKAEAARVALMADDRLHARATNPVHTMADGDTVFVLGTGRLDAASPTSHGSGRWPLKSCPTPSSVP